MPLSGKYNAARAGIGAAALALGLIAASAGTQAAPRSSEQATWGEWQAISGGFVGRRREPHGMGVSRAERQALPSPAKLSRNSFRGSDLAAVSAKESVPPSGHVWLYTQGDGVQSVSIAELALKMGKSEASIRDRADQGRLVLRNARKGVAWYYDAAGDSIQFVAETYDTFFTSENAYHLKFGGGKRALRMAVAVGEGPAETALTAFPETLLFEEEPDMVYIPWAVAEEPEADFWFWDVLSTGFPDFITREFTFDAPDPDVSGNANLRVRLRGASELQTGDDHYVTVALNGVDVAAQSFDGFQEVVISAAAVQDYLMMDGTNTVALTISGIPDGGSRVYVDDIELDYQRQPVAKDGFLRVHNAVGGLQSVSGFSSDQISVYEVADGGSSVRQDVAVVDGGTDGFIASFDALAGADYVVMQQGTAALPEVAIDERSSLQKRSNGSDYLIIAPRSLTEFAEELASYRRQMFGAVKIVWLEDIYDQYAQGRKDPAAVTLFMEKVRKRWSQVPSYVVLLGKGSLDLKDRMGYGDGVLPVRFVSTPWSIVASDDALLGNDGRNDLAIGRIAVTTNEDGLLYLQKMQAYEEDLLYGNFASHDKAVLFADNADSAGDFPANTVEKGAYLGNEGGFFTVEQNVHVSGTAVRTAFNDPETWNSGYVSYDGHGSTQQLGNYSENFFNESAAASLTNTGRPIFSALTCSAGNDWYPNYLSLASALVLNPDGGAIAALAPAGASLDADAHTLGMSLAEGLFETNESIGNAATAAKAANVGVIRDFMPLIYDVKGDPALNAR
ncbi:hypothetical protein BST95_00480 [Halioglobus japonicus]|nr:C25 family cysteine peptidase [Halioglobus japonicus]AQA16922.1 hypothetical protein BST95_00480 [Halioglobus japonicus]GHD21514.1 hypothetical protein GCM10007052_32380 [Halioglobus japonicus]